MKNCIKCGSHAFNLYADGIDQGGFCDVHYWQGRAIRAEALAQPAQKPQISTEELVYMTGVYDGKVLEREACAKVCESYLSESPHSWGGTTMAAAIRARGQA
jgi:hypothetical protein